MLALMILLLPLRGWMGDAMATSMAAGQLNVMQAAQDKGASATKSIAAHAHGYWAEDNNHSKNADPHALSDAETLAMAQNAHDCGMQAMVEADSAANPTTDCATCASCQACHTVALSPMTEKSIVILKPAAQADAAAQNFASADTALSQKPPIF